MQDETFLTKGANDRPEHYDSVKAWRHEEIASAFQPATWTEKDPATFATYPKRNQGVQSSCVLYTSAKMLAVDELSENGAWRELSPHSGYPYLALPGGGANSLDAAKFLVKFGLTLEALFPTDGLGETDVQSAKGFLADAKQVALVYRAGSFVECKADFETIASVLQGYQQQGQKKVVAATIVGLNNGTWRSQFPKPPATMDTDNFWYHRVPFTDFGLIGGKPYLSIDQSWGESVGLKGQQFLGKDYEPFMYGGIYTLNTPDNLMQAGAPSVPPPKHQWDVNLSVGSSGPDVLALQQALQSMGMFPISSVVKPTGNFFGVTRAGVILFQSAFGLPATGIVDAVTRAKLNGIFQ